MIDQQRWNTYLGINFKDRALHLCEQNEEAFFVTMKLIVYHAVFIEKQKGDQIPTMDTSISLFMGQCFAIVRLKKMQTLKIIIRRLQIDYFSGHAKIS